MTGPTGSSHSTHHGCPGVGRVACAGGTRELFSNLHKNPIQASKSWKLPEFPMSQFVLLLTKAAGLQAPTMCQPSSSVLSFMILLSPQDNSSTHFFWIRPIPSASFLDTGSWKTKQDPEHTPDESDPVGTKVSHADPWMHSLGHPGGCQLGLD